MGDLALLNGSLKICQSSVAVSAVTGAFISNALRKFRHQAEIWRHRLEFARWCLTDEMGECSDHRGVRQLNRVLPLNQPCCICASQPASGNSGGIALSACDLAGGKQMKAAAELESWLQ